MCLTRRLVRWPCQRASRRAVWGGEPLLARDKRGGGGAERGE